MVDAYHGPQGPGDDDSPAASTAPAEPVDLLASLTPRERQVADLVAAGLPRPPLAPGLCLSPRTVESHIARIYRKAGVSSRAALASAVTRGAAPQDRSPAADRGPVDGRPPRTGEGRRLIGREHELEAAAAVLAALASGTGRAIALVGEPGIGKSSLLHTATMLARAAGIPVLAGRGSRATPPGPDSDDGSNIGGSNGGPFVNVLDDLHDLAAEHIADIERLIESTATAPVLCFLAYRQRQLSPPLAALLSRAASAGLLEVWNLGPLSPAQTRELLGDHPDPDAVHRAAKGNPQYLRVLAAEDEAVLDVGTAILGELAGLDPTLLTVVQAAAVLGDPFRPDLLAAVAGLERPDAMAALDTLTRLDLVRPAQSAPYLSLRHPAIGKVVHRRLEPGRRTALHHRAEAELARRAAPIAERAHHIAQAADPNRPEHATTLIAAARGLLYSSPAVASGHLQVALSLLQEGGPHWYEAQVLLVRSRLLTGDASEGRALLGALRSDLAGEPLDESTALADSIRIERFLGRYTEAGAIARAGLAALTDDGSAAAAALHAELADYSYDVQDYRTSRHHAETAAILSHRHRDRLGEANALSKEALSHLFTGDQDTALARTASAAELIDAADDATLVTNLDAALQLGITEGMLGRLDDAERHLGRGSALSGRTGQTYIHPQILTVLANAQLRSGRLHAALATLDEADQHLSRIGHPATEAILTNVRAEALFWRDRPGDLDNATAMAERAVAATGGAHTAWAVAVCCFNAEFVLHTGDPARARLLLLDAAGGSELPRLTAWRRPRWCDTLAQAAAETGDPASVGHWARLAEAALEHLPSAGRQGFALRARMRAHVGRGDTDRALDSAQDAIEAFSTGGERLELGRTLVTAASLALDADRTGAVGGWLDRAALLADRCGSARMADDVTTLRARLAARSLAPSPRSGSTARPLLPGRVEQSQEQLRQVGFASGADAQPIGRHMDV